MIKETGFVNGIENYSIYFDKRQPGEAPNTIFDYFPDDCLVIVDESHLSVGQLAGMPAADYTRKVSLIEHGFRLPSAIDHRPLGFEELQQKLKWIPVSEHSSVSGITPKSKIKTLFVSATPAKYELEHSSQVVEQIIRPT